MAVTSLSALDDLYTLVHMYWEMEVDESRSNFKIVLRWTSAKIC